MNIAMDRTRHAHAMQRMPGGKKQGFIFHILIVSFKFIIYDLRPSGNRITTLHSLRTLNITYNHDIQSFTTNKIPISSSRLYVRNVSM